MILMVVIHIIDEYIDKMPLNTMYEQLLGLMILDLSNNATSNTCMMLYQYQMILLITKYMLKKQIEIVNDFEIYTHCKMAFDLTRKLNEDFHWESVKNLVKILIKQKEINEIIFILTDFMSNQSNPFVMLQLLLYMLYMFIFYCVCVLFEFCSCIV